MHITLDYESYSEADLRSVGAWKYWQHPSTEPLMLTGVWDGGHFIWLKGQPIPPELIHAIENGWTFDCHNAGFEQAAWAWCVKNLGWPELPIHRWDDTMARCAALSLPLALDNVGRVLHLPVQKSPAGKKWLLDYTRPRKPTKNDPTTRRVLTPEALQVGMDYCLTDSKAEHGLRKAVKFLSAQERTIWLLDQKINQRGVRVDLGQVHAAKKIVAQVEEKLTKELQHVTKGAVQTHGQVQVVLDWLKERGCELEDLTADTVKEARTSGKWKGTDVQRVLEIRQTLAKASTKKLNAFEKAVCSDGRVRYMVQYHGANTGRWAGRLINLQNLPRPLGWLEKYDPEALAATIGTGELETMECVYGDEQRAMEAIATGLRGMLIPSKGRRFIAADYHAIEAVGLAGLSGEEAKLDVFRKGLDPYCTTASVIFGYPVLGKETHPKERQVGKVGELAFGYGGGVGAWRNFDDSDTHSDDDVRGYRDKWRRGHPNIVKYWAGLEAAAIKAMLHGRGEYEGIVYSRKGDFLVCTLLSGRNISYYKPELHEKELPWSTPERPALGLVLSYMSQKGGKWRRVTTWGGKLAENVTQAACRDVLAVGMLGADAAWLDLVLHVHDEIVIEADERDGTAEETLMEAMTVKQPWYSHWPVKVETWEGYRYRK